MKFETTWTDGTKVQVEVSDADLRDWLRAKVESAEAAAESVTKNKRGTVTGASIV